MPAYRSNLISESGPPIPGIIGTGPAMEDVYRITRRVAKSKPLRKVPQTDAIFEAVHRINREADADAGTIRLSLDTKTAVPIGNLSRGGKSRQAQQALDHDLEPLAKLTPFGIHRPETAETWLSFTTGSVTADFMVDRLHAIWPTLKKTVIVHIPS